MINYKIGIIKLREGKLYDEKRNTNIFCSR